MENLFDIAKACILTRNPDEKVQATQKAVKAWRSGELAFETHLPPVPIEEPGRPEKPELVSPKEVPKRGLGSEEGRAALYHALTHIEFNAINLAWDAVYRFREMPRQFYEDWMRVADEEAYHFTLLSDRLNELGHQYGDFTAHNNLWTMACDTAHDPLVRMALVPRVMEARGLDVTPRIMHRLQQVGDDRTVSILEIILRDEIGHVKIGSHWFHYLCEQRNLDPEKTFRELISKYYAGQLNGPFHYEARLESGFSKAELKSLETLFQAK